MSAIYSVAYPNSVQMLTDGAIYTKEGVVLAIEDKAKVSQAARLVAAGRGDALVTSMFSLMVAGVGNVYKSFDRTIDKLQEAFAANLEKVGRLPPFEIVIAGWSETRGPVQYLFAAHSGYDSHEAFKLTEVGPEIGFTIPLRQIELIAAGITPHKLQQAGEDGLRLYGANLMEAMRRKPGVDFLDPESFSTFGIGGHCDLTIVSEHGVEQQRLRTWPDIVGELIDPFAEDQMAA